MSKNTTALESQWQALSQALDGLRSGQGSVDELAARVGDATELRAALPKRFDTVLGDLVDRMSASALFVEESCSFSQKDLMDSLQSWLGHARLHLGLK